MVEAVTSLVFMEASFVRVNRMVAEDAAEDERHRFRRRVTFARRCRYRFPPPGGGALVSRKCEWEKKRSGPCERPRSGAGTDGF
ncbi:hypothetical protein FRZ61_13520 [Hypericibacter adhaerens]|uniref:Uncharacterized protein n=1 Tax=Hypericibacter adhaerens TaxID=2602016 RepID=A0A5J6MWD9_9PROT|nr:hypothetical protein FRZ61_13520 [Hypericibacter adhaerens]